MSTSATMTSMSGMSGMSGSGTGTMTMPAAAASSTAASSMSGMGGMDMGGGNACKINMLWNWYTIDACFLSSSWHITSRGMFAGSCIGVIGLVLLLEFLRRSVKEYDRFLVRQHVAKFQESSASSSSTARLAPSGADAAGACCTTGPGGDASSVSSKNGDGPAKVMAAAVPPCAPIPPFRPNVFQQAVRALLHMFQFAIAYFVMLLAMYYNGYIIICIFIGAFLGSFLFQWEQLSTGGSSTSAATEATVCCG